MVAVWIKPRSRDPLSPKRNDTASVKYEPCEGDVPEEMMRQRERDVSKLKRFL